MTNMIDSKKMGYENVPIFFLDFRDQMFQNAIVNSMKILYIERRIWITTMKVLRIEVSPRIITHKNNSFSCIESYNKK